MDYTVSALARLSGVTVRTLHHYDRIGLLKPMGRTESGYRLYGEAQALRLQQILFFRELQVPLSQVQAILDDPGFDPVLVLQRHRALLTARRDRLSQLVATIDKTIARIKGRGEMLSDKELYEGFAPEQPERYRREARERYGADVVEASENRVRNMSPARWKEVGAEGEAIAVELAPLMDNPVDDERAQDLVARHHAWIEHFFVCPAETYRALGSGYVDDPEFRAFYDRHRPGLAGFLCEAMDYYATHVLEDGEGQS